MTAGAGASRDAGGGEISLGSNSRFTCVFLLLILCYNVFFISSAPSMHRGFTWNTALPNKTPEYSSALEMCVVPSSGILTGTTGGPDGGDVVYNPILIPSF